MKKILSFIFLIILLLIGIFILMKFISYDSSSNQPIEKGLRFDRKNILNQRQETIDTSTEEDSYIEDLDEQCTYACCSDSDCDDDNDQSQDKCINPLTSQARCDNSNVKTLLKSDYLGFDETALSIARGERDNYRFSYLYEGIIHLINVDPNKFQYKILSAFRMLGYSLEATQDKKLLIRWANAFQKRYTLPISDIITKDFVIKLDEQIYNHEKQIGLYIDIFPIDEDFEINNYQVEYIEHHKNEPSKNHVRFFYSYLVSSLPDKIAPMTKENIHNLFIGQAHGVIYNDNGWKLNYIPGASPLNKETSGIYKSSKLSMPDSKNASIFFHEYGHHIDNRFVNTIDFYEIMFDMNDCSYSVWKTCKPKPDAKFVSDYALSWENPEDPNHYSIMETFAESFAMYVINGQVYRKLTTINPNYQLQYNWLKENVFEGVEYCTGDENLIRWDSPSWDYTNNQIPSGIADISDEAFIPNQVDEDNPTFTLFDLIKKCN